MKQAKAVAYLRVSTKDKGQNPERQREILQEWCDLHGVELVGSWVDEGTSATKTNPFERSMFLSAVRSAQTNGAAILVEKHDRFTRQGSHEFGWAITELKRSEPSVELWVASKGGPEDQDREFIGAVTDAMEAESASKWARDHGARVRSGMRTAKKAKKHVGRPRKALSVDEFDLARELQLQGKGVRAIATHINRVRGLYDRADPENAIRKHGVRKSLVHQYLAGDRTVES